MHSGCRIKQIIFIFFLLLLLFSTVSCGDKTISDNKPNGDSTSASKYDFEFKSKAAVDAFTVTNGDIRYEEGRLVYTVNSQNSYIESPVITKDPGTEYSAKLTVKNTILLRMKNDTDTEQFKVYYVTDSSLKYNENKCVTITVNKGAGFENVYANLSACKEKSGYLRAFRIVPVGATSGSITIDAISFEREKALYNYAGEIQSCIANGTEDTVTIKGILNPEYANVQVKLYEISVSNWREAVDGQTPITNVTADGTSFTIVIPFHKGKITRLSALFLATVVTEKGEIKISDRFMVENYRDFSENPYAFTLPDLTVKVTDSKFGAKGDGFTNDNSAIQAAIDYVHKKGGGTVVLEGDDSFYGRRYIATRLQLKDNVELRIEAGAVLWQSPREEDYDYDVLRGHDITIPSVNWTHTFLCHNYPLILASECKNVRVTGGGVIRMNDAGSENLDGVDPTTLWTGCENRIHIIPIVFSYCDGVELSDITVLRTSGYHASMKGSQHVYVGNFTGKEVVCASGDGVGLGSTKHVLVDRFTVYSNDDAITLTSSYNDPRGMRWWHATPGKDNGVFDITVKSSHIFGGHGITFLPWGTDAPDLSKQQIRDIEVFDCILRGPHSVGTWPDNPYNGNEEFDNSETDDFSPVSGVRIHDNLYLSVTSLDCIKATDVITDCGIVSNDEFVHGDFERRHGKKDWISGLSNWSYTIGKGSTVEAKEIKDDHKGYINGTGSLYQGLHVEKGTYNFFLETDLKKGEGYIFVRDAISGQYLVKLPLRKGYVSKNEITFTVYKESDLELGIELTKSGKALIDNALLEVDAISSDLFYPDDYTEEFEYESSPSFNYSFENVIEEDGNKILKVDNPGKTAKGMILHTSKKVFDLRFHLKITDVKSSEDGNFGIYFLRVDGNNSYFLEYNSVKKHIQIKSIVKNDERVLLDVKKELDMNKWYQLGLRVDSGVATVYLDGEKIGSADINKDLKGARLHTNVCNTGVCMDNITLAPAGSLDMTEIVPISGTNTNEFLLTMNTFGGKLIIRPFLLSVGDKIPDISTPALEGYEFIGWTLDGQMVDLATFTMPDKDVVLVASWKATAGEKSKIGCMGSLSFESAVLIGGIVLLTIRRRRELNDTNTI